MSNITKKERFREARELFCDLIESIDRHAATQTRIDLVERSILLQLLKIGFALLHAFIAAAGDGDEGEVVETSETRLLRSEHPHQRLYHSIFGKLTFARYVYAPGPKKKAAYLPVDARLGLPAGDMSYVLEDWLERLCVKQPFAEGVADLESILNLQSSVRSAEVHNRKMAQSAESFRLAQPAPIVSSEATILVVTADGTSVPMDHENRTAQPHPQAGAKAGTTRRAYVGGVYQIAPWYRTTNDILDELLRNQALQQRPRPEGKRLWAEMAFGPEENVMSGSARLFAEMAIDVKHRSPAGVVVCLMDGECKLWEHSADWFQNRNSVEILDLFHVLKRVNDVAKVAIAKERRDAWIEKQTRDLLEGKVNTVIRRWMRLNSKNEVIQRAITYLSNNRHRMKYHEYLAKGYPIGSGVAEGACRNLVKDRMDRTGMKWTLEGARAMLWTRVLYLNGEWDEFVEHRIRDEQQKLYPSTHYGSLSQAA